MRQLTGRVPAGSLRPGDELACGLTIATVADCLPERLPQRYGDVTTRRTLLVLVDSEGEPLYELRIMSAAKLRVADDGQHAPKLPNQPTQRKKGDKS